jgi:hypothetical protein
MASRTDSSEMPVSLRSASACRMAKTFSTAATDSGCRAS